MSRIQPRYRITGMEHDALRRRPRLLVRRAGRAGARTRARRLVSQGCRVRRRRSAGASATRSASRWPAASATGARRRAARLRACSCSTSSRATSTATRRARSPATRARSRPPTTRSRAASTASSIAYERWFLYMPFEHAEDAGAQRRSLALFGALARETGRRRRRSTGRASTPTSIFRFGRYPHRNAILGRASTPEEEAFLREPGSRF